MPAGHDRCPRRRHQGARRAHRRLPRVDRVVGGPAARLRRRGMRAPVLAVGDGALGFWGALREVFPQHPGAALLVPQDRQRARPRCRSRRIRGRRRRWPRSGTPRTATTPATPSTAFKTAYGAKFPKAVAKITDDLDELLAFYDYPAEHWIHLRTTNPIESTFATVRHRTQGHQGPRLTRGRAGDGVQAHRGRPGPLASGQRTPPGRPRPRRRDVRQRQARRTTRRNAISPKPPKRLSRLRCSSCRP